MSTLFNTDHDIINFVLLKLTYDMVYIWLSTKDATLYMHTERDSLVYVKWSTTGWGNLWLNSFDAR